MEGLGCSPQAIEEANRKLGQLIDKLHPPQASLSLTAEQMAAVLAEIVRVGEWMRADVARNAAGQLAEELDRYRRHLEELRHLLPGLHAQLLTERSRLQAERAHLDAAAAWARSVTRQNP